MRMFAAAAASLLASASALADYAFVQIDYPGAPSTSVFGINQPLGSASDRVAAKMP